MEFFSHKTKIDFMNQRKWAFMFSGALLIFSLSSLFIKGINFGLDFTGGAQMEFTYKEAPDYTIIRQQLDKKGFKDATVQAYGSSTDLLVRLKPHKNMTRQQLINSVKDTLIGAKLQRVEYIGPQVGKTLVANGILAILVAMLGTMIYIAFRFEYRFALSAVISLIHDPMLILGVFAFFNIEFDLISLAALLTVIGYSLNDTIVVYDRIRENFRKIRKSSTEEIINLSVNQTLSRTIMISGITFTIVLALLVFGGKMLFGFALAMIIGILIGTYSSIYVAGSLAIMLGLDRKHLLHTEKKYVDNMP